MAESPEYKIWFHYMGIQLAIKHDFHIIDLTKPNATTGFGPMDKLISNDIGIRYFRMPLKIQGFEEFMANDGPYGYKWYVDILETDIKIDESKKLYQRKLSQ